jgi:hypothetical protein
MVMRMKNGDNRRGVLQLWFVVLEVWREKLSHHMRERERESSSSNDQSMIHKRFVEDDVQTDELSTARSLVAFTV